jgi:hypothetical protein
MKSFVTLIALSFGVGCGGTSTNGGNNANGDGGTTGDDGGIVGDGSAGGDGASIIDSGPQPLGSYTIKFGPVSVAKGAENTQCVVKRLGNPALMHVGSIHNVLTQGSHHLIVYRTNDTVEQLTPFDCKPFVGTLNPAQGSPLMITQKKDELLTLPDGVAYTLQANQMIRLEMHYINPSANPIMVEGDSTFIPIADAAFKYEADFLFIGDPDISIPAHATQTLGPIFFKLPAVYATSNFFAITGHEHQYGTNVVIATATSASDPGTPVYNVPGWMWNEPKTEFFNPTFNIPANGGFKFTCDWNNTSAATVGFGESANNEMCFFWAYYYPSQGAKVCFHTDKVPGGVDFCCPGSQYCSLIPGQ